jgi:hypothetical protein
LEVIRFLKDVAYGLGLVRSQGLAVGLDPLLDRSRTHQPVLDERGFEHDGVRVDQPGQRLCMSAIGADLRVTSEREEKHAHYLHDY